MTVEPSYRYCPDPKFPTCMEMRCEVCDGEGYVLDGRLQAIADAYANPPQPPTSTKAFPSRLDRLRIEWPELAEAIEFALGGTDK